MMPEGQPKLLPPAGGDSTARTAELLCALDRSPAVCLAGDGQDAKLIQQSPLAQALAAGEDWWGLLAQLAEADGGCGAAVGAMLGLAIGDSVGHPLEFVPVDQKLPDGTGPRYTDAERPRLLPGIHEGQLQYHGAYNRFFLQPGQWTDDCSMALCLADSLLVNEGYHGGDTRCRWHMWWSHGYCNAFRHDRKRPIRCSVGLGGNVAKSLVEVEELADGAASPAGAVPGIYGSATNDAGNGSIMRLAPVPIAYHVSEDQAMDAAVLQSRATHPGCEAAACCCFMALFLTRAIAARKRGRALGAEPRAFVHEVARGFLAVVAEPDSLRALRCMPGAGPALDRLEALLECRPPSPKEQNWHWQQKELAISAAITARCMGPDGQYDPMQTYNGHPTMPSYFGSYCMDGLAMALWGLWHSSDFGSCITLVVNLLGDADTTAAIAGQLAGAMYGWEGIVAEEWGGVCLNNLRKWDPVAEVGLRAALLYHHGPRPKVTLRQAEGHATVRVFAEPQSGSAIVGELDSGATVTNLDRSGDFLRVRRGELDGWVGQKNTVEQPIACA